VKQQVGTIWADVIQPEPRAPPQAKLFN